jgi:hypothetical protein
MRAIADMEKIAQNTAATAQQNAAAGEELTTHTQQSLETVARIETMIGGMSDTGAAAPAQRSPAMYRSQPAIDTPR